MSLNDKVIIGSDEKRVEAKRDIVDYLVLLGVNCYDAGTDPSYAGIAERVARTVVNRDYGFGILICRTGIGMSIAAGKIPRIRAVRCVSEQDARDAREINDANVLTLSAVDPDLARKIVYTWLTTEFSGKEEYLASLDKITKIEAATRFIE